MKCTEVHDLAAAAAVGALGKAETARLAALAAEDAEVCDEAASLRDTAAAVAAAVTVATPPPAAVRESILRRIARTPQAQRPGAAVPAREGFSFVRRGEGEWLATPVPGFRIKVLSVNRAAGTQTILAELAPGAVFPPHHHDGVEDMFVISGDLVTEGATFGPGDFVHAEAGTHHDGLRSINGCTALITRSFALAA